MPRRASTHVDDPKKVGMRIREARERVGLKQRELVVEGCTAGYVSRIEAGERIPSYQLLLKFAEKLGVSADYLAKGEVASTGGDQLLLAELAARSGDEAEARKMLAKLIDSETKTSAQAQVVLARLESDAGEHARAATLLDAALSAKTLPAEQQQTALEQLGRAYALLSQFDEALAALNRALVNAKAVDDGPAVMRTAVLLANTHIDRGSYQRAEDVLADVIELARSMADPVALSNLFWSQARLHMSQQRHDLAAHYARLAHATLEATENTTFAARALLLLAQVENDRGDYATAIDLLDEATPAIVASGNRYDTGLTQLERARALAQLGRPEEAASVALGAVANFEDSHPTSAARGFSTAAEIFVGLGEPERAVELYELAAEVLPARDRHLVDIFQKLAAIHEEAGDNTRAMRYLKLALDAQQPLTIE